MKIYIVLLGLLLCAGLQAQVVRDDSFVLKTDVYGKTLAEVLDAIEQQTAYSFIYDARVIDLSAPVRERLQGRSLLDLLDLLFKDTDIAFTVVNKQIILNHREYVIRMQENQNRQVAGTVTDKAGEPIIGANILIKGTSRGTVTDLDGNFMLDLPPKATLQVSYIGYLPQKINYNGERVLHIQLAEDSQQLGEVIVTALGLHKQEASLPYATQFVAGDELIRAKEFNFIQTLAGKTAGVQINRTSFGLGSSARVIIRGYRSVSGNNQPLYVIDGIPMLNSSNEQAISAIGGTADSGNRDGGDGISNLNPDDIESMSILKGASAAALYGSQAANGVILITTKKGHADVQRVTFSSSLTVDVPSASLSSRTTTAWIAKQIPAGENVPNWKTMTTLAASSVTA